jgi:hypothetical protein
MKSIILLLLFSLTAFSSIADPPRDCVQNTYLSQVGIREATGRNDGPAVKMYLASTNLDEGYAWCAAFVNWTYQKCGVETPRSAAWSPSWFPSSKVLRSDQVPRAGDVFGIYYTTKKRVAHVGFIHKWPINGTSVTTVEGNTNDAGSREGDGVYVKYRLKSQIYQVADWIST